MKKCAASGCDKDVGRKGAKGFCSAHYHRFVRHGDPLLGGPPQTKRKPCSIDGCTCLTAARGWCKKHYARWRAHGDPNVVKNAPSGNGHINPRGYRMVWRPDHANATSNGTIAEHRLVMSEMLGRPLVPGESVHHCNGDKQNNHPSNLELWSKSQPWGQRVEDKVAWALEIIELYGSDFVQPNTRLKAVA